jgi:hypothetical protein
MSRLTHDENDEIADLERMARQRPTGDSGGDLNSFMQVDGKEGAAFGPAFPVGLYALEVTDLALKQSKGIDAKTGLSKEVIPYLEITFTCITGVDPTMAGQVIQDRLMAKGKGVTRFKIFAKAVGLWDDEQDQFSGRPSDFMGVQVWANVVTEKSVFKGIERERSIIDFAGYEPIDKYPLPDDDYFDDAAGDPSGPSIGPATAAPVEDDDDLETIEVEEEAEPVPQPAARPRARAAGQPGDTPPWKQ